MQAAYGQIVHDGLSAGFNFAAKGWPYAWHFEWDYSHPMQQACQSDVITKFINESWDLGLESFPAAGCMDVNDNVRRLPGNQYMWTAIAVRSSNAIQTWAEFPLYCLHCVDGQTDGALASQQLILVKQLNLWDFS